MSAYITTMATPTYVLSTDGFYKHSGTTLPSGTELTVKSKGIDNKSDREVGYLANGTIVYLDRLQPVTQLQEVEVRSTRLWDWLIGLSVLGGAIGYGVYRYKKSKRKGK